MRKIFVFMMVVAAAFLLSNCKSTNKYQMGDQEVVMYDRATLSWFGSNPTNLTDCIKDAGEEGATEVLAVAGRSCYGIFNMTCSSDSTVTSQTQACSVIGVNKL